MNRRELFSAVAGIAAGSGIELKASTYEQPTTKPALAVFEYPGRLSNDVADRMIHYFQEALKGTPFEGVKAIALCDGLKLTLLDKDGNVLNRTIENT